MHPEDSTYTEVTRDHGIDWLYAVHVATLFVCVVAALVAAGTVATLAFAAGYHLAFGPIDMEAYAKTAMGVAIMSGVVAFACGAITAITEDL